MSPIEVADGVWVVTAGVFPANSYICAMDDPGQAVLIDVGLDALPIDAALELLGRRPTAVFCTHGHFDHIGQASFFQEKYAVPVHLHREDLKTAAANNFLLMAMKLPARLTLPKFDLVDDGYQVSIGGRRLVYRHTPGHTPGSCVIEFEDCLFTGDTLYANGIGLSRLPGERPEQLRESISSIWTFLDGVTVHPGHGPSAAGREIKQNNSPLRSFIGLEPLREGTSANAR